MKAMMILCLAACAAAMGGCASYFQSQTELTAQVRKGVELCRQNQVDQQMVSAELHTAQRKRLDDGFDADVRQRAKLSAAWVIDARKAYGMALDGLTEERLSSAAADASMQRTFDAMTIALDRLEQLQSLPQRLWEKLRARVRSQ